MTFEQLMEQSTFFYALKIQPKLSLKHNWYLDLVSKMEKHRHIMVQGLLPVVAIRCTLTVTALVVTHGSLSLPSLSLYSTLFLKQDEINCVLPLDRISIAKQSGY